MKHYNAAHVWGRLKKFEEKETTNGKAFVDVVIDCASAKYGNVRAFGRLWGKFVKEFTEDFKPGDAVAMRGMISQYTGRKEALRTNFNFYGAEHWDPREDKHKLRRAAFIIVGEVLSINEDKDETTISLEFRPESGEPEQYELALHPDKVLDIEAGGIWRIKGAIVQDEDEWGDVIHAARPVALEVQKMQGPGKKDDEDVPF